MRSIKICWTLCKYGLFYKLTRHRKENFGQRLKLAFEDLGITFIKIGQILSMRYDLLSREDCEGLQQLLDKVSPIPLPVIYEVLEKEYGKPHNLVFKKFYDRPLGSASVSQVHKAELFDGTLVAVKIKRPNVDAEFIGDINFLKKLAVLGEVFFKSLRTVQAKELVKYFEGWIKQDLDFKKEVVNMKRIKLQYAFAHDNFNRNLGKGVFIQPFESFCTTNIIVMDFVDGVLLNDKERIRGDKNFDIEKSIKSYVSAAIHNWFRDDIDTLLFQGDPHLSNLLILPNGDAANIDYGLICEMSRQDAKISRELLIAVYFKDLDRVIRISAKMTGTPYQKCRELIKDDIIEYLEKSPDEGFGFWFLELAKIYVKHDIKFPLFLINMGRTNIMLDGLAKTYLPSSTTIDIVGEELKYQAINETWKNIKDIDWLKLAYAFSEKAKQGPTIITEVLNDPLAFFGRIISTVKST